MNWQLIGMRTWEISASDFMLRRYLSISFTDLESLVLNRIVHILHPYCQLPFLGRQASTNRV